MKYIKSTPGGDTDHGEVKPLQCSISLRDTDFPIHHTSSMIMCEVGDEYMTVE